MRKLNNNNNEYGMELMTKLINYVLSAVVLTIVLFVIGTATLICSIPTIR